MEGHMLTFTQATQLHHQHLRAKRRSPDTLTWYSEQFAAFNGWRLLQDPPIPDELPDADTIDVFIADQHEGHKPATVHARFRAIRALFLFLERRKKIAYDQNPIHLVDAPSVPTEIRRHVSIDALNQLLSSITGQSWLDHRDRLIIQILFFSGLRCGELCALSVGDIDTKRAEITVDRGKGDKARVVPATPELASVLVPYLFGRPAHTDILLLASDGYAGCKAGGLQPEGVRQMLIRRCKRAGLERAFNPHAFRHGFAMWLLNGGARLTTVSTAMGHSDTQITSKIYAHTTTTTVRREYDDVMKATKTPHNG
jgi:site-specific recombinase XerD